MCKNLTMQSTTWSMSFISLLTGLEQAVKTIMKTHDNASEKSSGSQRTCSGRVRPRLPSPVSSVRRRKKFWTPEEVEALREGVKEYGKSWKDIKNANPVVFAERTEVENGGT